MVDPKTIQEFSERVAREFQPERIILFGSYAYGNPTPTSDVDLLVILPFEGPSVRKALEIIQRATPPFPLDLIVRTPDQVRQRLAWNDYFLREIIERGKVLYAAPNR